MAMSRVRVLVSFCKLQSTFISPSSQMRRFSSSSPQVSYQFESVGFIGLGNMGFRMASNLMKAGYKMSVYDINCKVKKMFSDMGVPTKETPFEVAEASDVVITMLPSSSHVLDVYNGPNGLLQEGTFLRPRLLIDSSTIDPQTSRKISAAVSKCILKEKKDLWENPVMLDAPVSGGVLAAEAGTLTFMVLESCYYEGSFKHCSFKGSFIATRFMKRQVGPAADSGTHTPFHPRKVNVAVMKDPSNEHCLRDPSLQPDRRVGGSEDAYLAAKPILLSMGKSSIYCGGAGTGSAAKICNNLAMAVSMLGVSEALTLGQSLGVTASTLTKIFNSSSARCWSSDTYNPVPGVMEGVPSSRNYGGGFASKLMAKDLNLASASAKQVDVKCPLTSQAQEIYTKLCEDGHETEDFSCVFRHYYSGKDEL